MSTLHASLPYVLALMLVTRIASADPKSLRGGYSAYERLAIRDAEKHIGALVDPSPEGKTIEHIDFVRLDPIDHRDPLPGTIDALHTTTKEYVVRRALLVAEGQPWRSVLVDESARNLRRLPQLSLVLCVPLIGSAPDRVRLVVITKDVWSLHVDFDVAVTSGGLESLTIEPKESNIAGTHQVALARLVLEPKTMTFGVGYETPRVEGRWLSIDVDANAVVNRDTGAIEGAYGAVRALRPLFSSRTEWAWSTGTTFGSRVRRRYVNAVVATYRAPPAEAGAGPAAVPWVWRERRVVQDAKITRSFGWATKNDVSFGVSFAHTRYEVPAYAGVDARVVTAFRRAAVPTGEDRVGPFVQWHGYRSDFLRTFDLDSLGLQEDHRLGHDVWLRAYPVLRALGSTRNVFGTYAGAAYGFALGDGLARVAVEATVEAEPHRITDAWVKGSLGIATPHFGPSLFPGRLVFLTTALSRIDNYLNVQSFLGGDTLLRGYPSRYLDGKDLIATNLEYRSRSLDLAAVQIGAAAFYDVGDAFSGFDHLDPKQSIGGGLRIVFPQISRSVLRLDVGVPVSSGPRPPDVPPVSVFFAFHNALTLPTIGSAYAP
jgi:hypothetical protein